MGNYIYKDEAIELAEALPSYLAEQGIEPDYSWSAAAGADWGHVSSWEIGSQVLIEASTNAETDVYIVANDEFDADSLVDYLAGDDDMALPLTRAHLLGELPELPEGYAGPCLIIREAHLSDASTRYTWVEDEDGDPLEFASPADAEAWLDSRGPEYLGHGEMGTTYHVVPAE